MNQDELRKIMITNMKSSIKFIKTLLKLSDENIGEFIGVSKETISNWENKEGNMTATEYVSLCALIDNQCSKNPEILPIINAVIKANAIPTLSVNINELYDGLFLDKWFSTFTDNNLSETYEVFGWDMLDEDLLDKLAENYKVFVNYDSLMMYNSYEFFIRFTKILKKHKSKAIIPLRVIEKLKSLAEDLNYSPAILGIKCLVKMQSENVIEIRGEESDYEHPDELFTTLLEKYNEKYRLAFITQNETLAKNLFKLQSFDSSVLLCKINNQNELNEWDKSLLEGEKNVDVKSFEEETAQDMDYLEQEDKEESMEQEKNLCDNPLDVNGGWSIL